MGHDEDRAQWTAPVPAIQQESLDALAALPRLLPVLKTTLESTPLDISTVLRIADEAFEHAQTQGWGLTTTLHEIVRNLRDELGDIEL